MLDKKQHVERKTEKKGRTASCRDNIHSLILIHVQILPLSKRDKKNWLLNTLHSKIMLPIRNSQVSTRKSVLVGIVIVFSHGRRLKTNWFGASNMATTAKWKQFLFHLTDYLKTHPPRDFISPRQLGTLRV